MLILDISLDAILGQDILVSDQCKLDLSGMSFNSLKPSDTYMRQQTNHYWFRQWLVTWPVPSHYLNQC